MYYPLVKYFPPFPANDFLGFPIKVGSIDHLVNTTLNILKQDAAEGTVNQPALLSYTENFAHIWKNVKDEVKFIIIVLQVNNTFLGETLALDFLTIPFVKVAIVYNDNNDVINSLGPLKYPSTYLIDRKNVIVPVLSSDLSRFSVYSSLTALLSDRGYNIPHIVREIAPTDINVDVSQVMALMEVEEQIKKKLNLNALSDVVFQIDLEGALRQSLRVEIPSHKTINGEPLDALKLYFATLIDFFPFGKKGLDFLNAIYSTIKDTSHLRGSEFMNIVTKNEQKYDPYLSPESSWIGCRGSQPRYRGYPCSLWTLFHTLTVHADHAREANGKKVLQTMLGYIKHFFGCSDCSAHFQQMAVTFEGNVSSTSESILWLWKAHNNVNDRLKSDQSEDPMHPKVQFPPPTLCRACRFSNGSWNEPIVLPFLKSMYMNISYFTIEEVPQRSTTQKVVAANMLRHENIVDEKTLNYSQTESKLMLLNFNIFDASLFVLLYLFSMAIIILVCIKFLFKKSYRKKTYAYDIFQKV